MSTTPLTYNSDCVGRLDQIENHFLQVLVDRFTMRRLPCGINLRVEFDGSAYAIWNSSGKSWLRENAARQRARVENHQRVLEDFFSGKGPDSYSYTDANLPFRFVSGGALPVVRIDNENYYALIYRECEPIGWNLTNGGSDNRQEMLNPFITVERELREELIIAHFGRRQRFVFDMESDNPEDMPEHVVARHLWSERLHLPASLDSFDAVPTPIKWIDGPDSLDIRIGSNQRTVNGCFLNINATDGGIEIDRIVKIRVEDAAFLDGEILNGGLVGSVVGLFEVSRMRRELENKSADDRPMREFIPDTYFFNGLPHAGNGTLLKTLSEEYLPHVCKLVGSQERRLTWEAEPCKFDLCPATRSILTRAVNWIKDEQPPDTSARDSAHDIFISFPSEDVALADCVYHFLSSNTSKSVYFSTRDMRPSFANEIDRAIESATLLIAVSTRPEYLRKPWLEYEYNSFNVLKLSNRKPKHAGFISYVAGFDPKFLPLPLLVHKAIEHDAVQPSKSLQEILDVVNCDVPR